MPRYSELTADERRQAARRLRLEWASGRDRAHAAGVARMIADAERANRANRVARLVAMQSGGA